MDNSLRQEAETTAHGRLEKRGNTRRSKGCFGFVLGFLIPLLGGVGLLLSMPDSEENEGFGQRLALLFDAWRGIRPEPEIVVEVREKIFEVEVEVEKQVPGPPAPPPVPSKWVPRKEIDTATLYNGLLTRTSLDEFEGQRASVERATDESYGVEIKVRIAVPRPATVLAEFAGINPELPKVLPGLGALLDSASVSDFYHLLYDNKRKRVQRDYSRLNKVLDRHNFYDCESILELRAAQSGRRVLLIQSEMDVVSDGTDGDRMPDLDAYIANSANFQPSTGYMWKKQTSQPNPLLKRYTDAIARDEALLKKPGIKDSERSSLKGKLAINRRIADDLKFWSYLIAEADPFVVVPLSIVQQKGYSDFVPQVGDYAVVVHGRRLFPTIVGDVGPSYKVGEGSLRLCREINPKATVYSRPESDLKVTYLCFPGSAEPTRQAPDLNLWYDRCAALLEEIGGIGEGYHLHRWDDWFAPEPEVAPGQEQPLEASSHPGEPVLAAPAVTAE